jgi:glutamine amidotransferase
MIAIIDYEMGNLRSVEKAIQHVGGDAQIVRKPDELARADKIILPGVAAFADAMGQLHSQGLVEPIQRAVRAGTPMLGFCLGLQLLFDVGYEDGEHKGIGVLPGKVVRFQFPDDAPARLAVPHMGWNQLQIRKPSPMLEGISDGDYVYFAHSYYVQPADESIVATTTEYGLEFASSVASGSVFATQFHPEKSQAVASVVDYS